MKMAVPFIFFITVVAFVLLAVSFVIKLYFLGAISSIAIIAIGVFILINGMESISNILTLGLGIIFISLGSYIFLTGALEKIEEEL